jgi:hypothetical protein
LSCFAFKTAAVEAGHGCADEALQRKTAFPVQDSIVQAVDDGLTKALVAAFLLKTQPFPQSS